MSCRWFHESSRWLFLNNKSELGIKNLQSVGRINGHSKESEKLDVKVSEFRLTAPSSSGATPESLYLQMVKESMKKELAGSQDSYSFMDLFRTPTLRLTTISLSAVWYDAAWSTNKNARLIPRPRPLGSRPASPTTACPWTCRSSGWTST